MEVLPRAPVAVSCAPRRSGRARRKSRRYDGQRQLPCRVDYGIPLQLLVMGGRTAEEPTTVRTVLSRAAGAVALMAPTTTASQRARQAATAAQGVGGTITAAARTSWPAMTAATMYSIITRGPHCATITTSLSRDEG